MVWELGRDGFEYSHFNQRNRPIVYVKRKVSSDGCLFVDFPDTGDVETRVACGAIWFASNGGYTLRCDCLDGGEGRGP